MSIHINDLNDKAEEITHNDLLEKDVSMRKEK